MSKKIAEQVWKLAEPVVEGFGLSLWDVEYVREGADWFLRLYIDKDGPVDISDCEKVSRAMDPILDEADPIPDSYNFEVCSAGCERTLKRPGDFQKFLGSQILVKLYGPRMAKRNLSVRFGGITAVSSPWRRTVRPWNLHLRRPRWCGSTLSFDWRNRKK